MVHYTRYLLIDIGLINWQAKKSMHTIEFECIRYCGELIR